MAPHRHPLLIPPGGLKTYVASLTPTGTFPFKDILIIPAGANATPSVTIVGLNTVGLSSSVSQLPDPVAVVITPSNDGVVRVPLGGSTPFGVAMDNIGSPGSVVLSTSSPPGVQTFLCQTNPFTAACISPIQSRVIIPMNTGDTPTIGFFVSANAPLPFDPANTRIHVDITLATTGDALGGTHVAVTTEGTILDHR